MSGIRYLLGVCLLSLGLWGCGFKAPPQPLRQALPEAPANLAVRQLGGRMLIAWNLPSRNQDGSPAKDLAGFNIYRMSYDLQDECPDCRDTSVLLRRIDLDFLNEALRSGERLFWFDSGLEPETGYQYRVTPLTVEGYEGAPSQLRRPFLVPPLPPAALTASGHDRLVRLEWSPVEEVPGGQALLGYNLYRRSGDAPYLPLPLNREVLTETGYDDFQVENGQGYDYLVRTIVRGARGSLESEASVPVSVTPEAGR